MALHPAVAWGQPPAASLRNTTPGPVARGLARLRGARSTRATLSLNVDLATREPAQLEELIRAASTPGSPSYGHYLTPVQYAARFAPTAGELRAVEAWLRGLGLHVVGASPDNSLVHVDASTAAVERALAVNINNYAFQGREFYATDRAPSIPSSLHVDWIGGLSSYNSFHYDSADHCVSKSEPVFCGYFGTDFRAAYDLSGSGEGQTIGFTLWEVRPSERLHEICRRYWYDSAHRGRRRAQRAGIHTGRWFLDHQREGRGGPRYRGRAAVAPGIHETYWLGATNTESTLETVLDDAANSKIAVISSSWGFACSSVPGGVQKILQAGASTGKTFYFSSGDNGAEGGTDCPGLSPNVVDVGGTELHVGPNSEWKSENALLDDGGCSNDEARPAWQTGIGSPLEWPSKSCSGRAIPDISADSRYGGREADGRNLRHRMRRVPARRRLDLRSGWHQPLSPDMGRRISRLGQLQRRGRATGHRFRRPAALYSLVTTRPHTRCDFRHPSRVSTDFTATKVLSRVPPAGDRPTSTIWWSKSNDINYPPAARRLPKASLRSSQSRSTTTVRRIDSKKDNQVCRGAETCEATTGAGRLASRSATRGHITGSDLTATKEVKLGMTPARKLQVDGSAITAETPAGKGTVPVTVTTTAGTSSTSPADEYTYLPLPSVSKIEPREGPETGATEVTITGSDLTATKEVKFGVTPAKSFKVESGSVITAETPAGKGTVPVTVTTTAGTSSTSPADEYTYLPLPSVSKIEPREGPETGATEVTITGSDLTATKEVKFGVTPAKSFKVESGSVITAETPAGKGTVPVTVTTTAGTSSTSPADEYTYVVPPSATTSEATEVTSSSATLNGSVNPNGSEVTECRFEYGSTMMLGSSVPCAKSPGSGTSAVSVSAPATGLAASTPYYFRLTARNAGGTSTGLEELLTTPGTASPPEFGRCLKAVDRGAAEYDNATCTKAGAKDTYDWYPAFGGTQPLAKVGFGLSLKEGTDLRLESGKQLITCKSQTGGGEYSGTQAVEGVVLTFAACERSGESCQSGIGAGEIRAQTLTGTLGVILASKEGPGKNRIGLDLRPSSGSTIAEFSCGGTPVVITGEVIAEVARNSMRLNTGLWTFAMAKGGKQKPEGFEGGAKQTLQIKTGTGAPEQAGLSLKTRQANEEKIEVSSVL